MSTRGLRDAPELGLDLIQEVVAQIGRIPFENVRQAFPMIAHAFENGHLNAVINGAPLIVWFMRYANPIDFDVLKMFDQASVDFCQVDVNLGSLLHVVIANYAEQVSVMDIKYYGDPQPNQDLDFANRYEKAYREGKAHKSWISASESSALRMMSQLATIVEFLIGMGVDPRIKDGFGDNTLHCALNGLQFREDPRSAMSFA